LLSIKNKNNNIKNELNEKKNVIEVNSKNNKKEKPNINKKSITENVEKEDNNLKKNNVSRDGDSMDDNNNNKNSNIKNNEIKLFDISEINDMNNNDMLKEINTRNIIKLDNLIKNIITNKNYSPEETKTKQEDDLVTKNNNTKNDVKDTSNDDQNDNLNEVIEAMTDKIEENSFKGKQDNQTKLLETSKNEKVTTNKVVDIHPEINPKSLNYEKEIKEELLSKKVKREDLKPSRSNKSKEYKVGRSLSSDGDNSNSTKGKKKVIKD